LKFDQPYSEDDEYEASNKTIGDEPVISRKQGDERSTKQRRLDILHETTGISKSALKQAINKEAISGSNISPQDLNGLNLENCESWYEANMKEFNIHHEKSTMQVYPKQLFCLDIGAKFPVIQRTGHLYPFIFIEASSKKLFFYTERSKDDADKVLSKFKSERDRDADWRYLQCDSESVLTYG